MPQKEYIVYKRVALIILFLLCEPLYASDCKSFQESLNIQNEAMEFVNCNINYEKQGVPIELMYRFKGIDALAVERYLISKFNINPIIRTAGRPYWYSYTQYHPEKNLEISIGTDENMHYTRDDWKYIDYFYIVFSKYSKLDDI